MKVHERKYICAYAPQRELYVGNSFIPIARLTASDGQIRVDIQNSSSKSPRSVTAKKRHNLLCVALATRHNNQCEIQQQQVLLTVPPARCPDFRQLKLGDY